MPDGKEKKQDMREHQPAAGFRFMGKSLGELLDLKASLRKRLVFLEENRARISPFVLRKLTQEYNSYLETVDSELALNLCEYEIKLSELRLFSSQLQLLRKSYSDNIEEIKLRHMLGEYSQEEYSRLISDHGERMRRFEENLARYDSEERKIQAFLERIGSGAAASDMPDAAPGPETPAPEMAAGVVLKAEPVQPPVNMAVPADDLPGPKPEPSPVKPPEAVEQLRPAAARLELHESRAASRDNAPSESVLLEITEVMTPAVKPETAMPLPVEPSAGIDMAGLPGLEEIAAATESRSGQTPAMETAGEGNPLSAAGGQTAGADDLFEALMREQSAPPRNGQSAAVQDDMEMLISPAPASPVPSAGEKPVDMTEILPAASDSIGQAGLPMDELERDLMQLNIPARKAEDDAQPGVAAEPEKAVLPSSAGFDLDLEALMNATRVPEPELPVPVKLAPEPAPAAESAAPSPVASTQTPDLPVDEITSPPDSKSEESSELRWEPLPQDEEASSAGKAAVPQPDKAAKRVLPMDDRIELTLDLDRSELDPQKILTVNQTIDAIKKKTVRCPNCGAMNYAIRWYCENCEATLTTL